MTPASFVTRFAPSPTGLLHLGHAYAALTAYDAARRAGGRFLLRIEDIDQSRCQDGFIDAILNDLAWLGLCWEEPVRRQSRHMAEYAGALQRLETLGLLYPCFCTRKEIQAEIARSPTAPHGPEGALYPGTCKRLSNARRTARLAAGTPYALRLDVPRAIALMTDQGNWPRLWHDAAKGAIPAVPETLGDVVLARKDMPTSYHLAVTLDDAVQGITHVIRGEDLFHATHVHVLLQALLGLPQPHYRHHPLLRDEHGQRLAKRRHAASLRDLRQTGLSAADIRARLGLPNMS